MKYVIVGNGVAGMEAALRIHAQDSAHQITIVSEESDHFFSRTALMWVHAGQLRHEDIEPLPRDVYERLGATRVRARAVDVDVHQRRVLFAGNFPPISYDRLLLACGSRPRPAPWPGSGLCGVGHFVTHQDLAWYEMELWGRVSKPSPPRARLHLAASTADSPYAFRQAAAADRGTSARAPVIVGGGLIGVEAVELALARGLRPHLLMRDEWCWPMGFSAREAAFVVARLREHGVHVHPDCEVRGFSGDPDGRIQGVETNHGIVACDVAVVAIGVVPNTHWLAGAPLARSPDGGLVVDEHLQTQVPGVFAAGDCAAVPGPDGQPRLEQFWYAARAQGRIAADAMLGGKATYRPGIPYNSAKVMDVEVTSVGQLQAPDRSGAEWYYEENEVVRSTLRIVLNEGRIIGFNALGRRYDHSVLQRFITQRRPLGWVLDHLREAAFDTEFVPPLRIRALPCF